MRIILVALLLTASSFFQVNSSAQTRATLTAVSQSNSLPAPEAVLGFVPGDDRKLANWNQIVKYFEELDRASNRVMFETLGKSTMDRPFIMATISAPENLDHLAEYKEIQRLLADPRQLGPSGVRDRRARELVRRGKSIVLITCGIHSTEVGSTLSSLLIAHRLASSNEPEIQEILRNTIILLVPSLNPDGVDIVKTWYDKTLGTPYEGTSPPELYHKYVGHDNNRDWYAFTQVETQITVDRIHNVWHPQIVHDIHQQGEFGARLFMPPYMPPVEPNVPKQIIEAYTELGNFMARELRAKGFAGITTDSTYDAWTPARAYSHYHGGVRILSETASARLASPITLKFDQLRTREGYDPKRASSKFGPVWHGGEWHLRDITNYMTAAAFKLLNHAAVNRESWLSRFYEIGKEAVRPRRKGELWGYALLPPERSSFYRLKEILERAGVEVEHARRELPSVAGRTHYPRGTLLIPFNQPYSAFAKALLETQQYPNLRDAAGHPVAPYDVTAHTLPLLMNVTAKPLTAPFNYPRPRNEKSGGGPGGRAYGYGYEALPRNGLYKSFVPAMDEGWTRWIMEEQHYRYLSLHDNDLRNGNLGTKFSTIIIPDQSPNAILNGHRTGSMPPEYTGGLGQQGVKRLREFVEEGGTLVCLNRASKFAIEQFQLPVRDVVANVSEKEFFVPGSILRLELDLESSITRGMERETIAWVEDSPVFESVRAIDGNEPPNVRVIARYPANKNPLLSGWLLGAERIKGKAALLEVTLGKGRIILFGFRPQYRAQSMATYPLFFNAISGR